MRSLRILIPSLLLGAAVALSACSNDEGAACPSAGGPTPTPTSAPSPAPTSTPPAFAESYDSNATMWAIFSDPAQPLESSLAAVEEAAAQGDVSMVPIIVEIMRFQRSPTLYAAYLDALETLTGQDFSGADSWNDAMEWLGSRRDQFRPPSEYLEWKTNILGLIDPRMAAFFTAAPGSERIDLTEAVWGGVRTDGIPDLQFPETLSPEEATYLDPRDRVFGVSINGEHRAYPLRIVNAHEMANDILGGEQIALAY